MKKIVLTSAATFVVMTNLPIIAMASTAQTTQYVETNHGWVSYHHSAKLSSPIDGRLLLGEKAQLIQKANNWWYEVNVNGRTEYITTNSNYTHVVTANTPGTSAPSSPSTTTAINTTPTSSSTNSATTAPATASSTVQYVETNHGWVSYHSAATLSSRIDGRLLLGEKAQLIQKTNNWWYEIKVNGRTEYITTNSNYTHVMTSSASTTSSSTSNAPTPASSNPSGTSTSTATPSWQVQADKLIATAKTQLGVPYLWGKQEPGVGFDCSNFVAWSYRTALGISFSGSSVYQRYHVGTPVALSNIRPGDLLFFATKNNSTGSGHVGIYIGNGQLIQEGGGYGKVTIEPLSGTWFGRNLVFASRVIQ